MAAGAPCDETASTLRSSHDSHVTSTAPLLDASLLGVASLSDVQTPNPA